MSTTPRTDAEVAPNDPTGTPNAYVTADFASQLETELTACTARIAEVERERDTWKRRAEEKVKLTRVIGEELERARNDYAFISVERDTLAADNTRLKEVIGFVMADYDHPWPNEDEDTKEHRLRRLSQMLSTKGGDEICANMTSNPAPSVAACLQTESESTSSASNAAPENVPPVSGSRQRTIADGSFDIGTGEFIEASSPVPASGNEGTPESKGRWVNISSEITIQKLESQLADEHRAKNVALRERDELKRRVEEVDNGAEAWEQLACSFPAIQADAMKEIEAAQFIVSEYEKVQSELATLKADIERKDAALTKLASYNQSIIRGEINYRPNDHIQVAESALSPTAPKKKL